jgi:hypothetical protein
MKNLMTPKITLASVLFGSDSRGSAPGCGQAARATVGARRRIRADCGEDTRLPESVGQCR